MADAAAALGYPRNRIAVLHNVVDTALFRPDDDLRDAAGIGGDDRPAAGVIVPERTPEALAQSIRQIIANSPDSAAVRAHAEAHGWDEVIAEQIKLYQDVRRHRTRLVA